MCDHLTQLIGDIWYVSSASFLGHEPLASCSSYCTGAMAHMMTLLSEVKNINSKVATRKKRNHTSPSSSKSTAIRVNVN